MTFFLVAATLPGDRFSLYSFFFSLFFIHSVRHLTMHKWQSTFAYKCQCVDTIVLFLIFILFYLFLCFFFFLFFFQLLNLFTISPPRIYKYLWIFSFFLYHLNFYFKDNWRLISLATMLIYIFFFIWSGFPAFTLQQISTMNYYPKNISYPIQLLISQTIQLNNHLHHLHHQWKLKTTIVNII